MPEIGLRLREERGRLDMNQTEFGALAGVTKKSQMNYESGRRSPSAEYLANVAAAGVDVLYVVTGVRVEALQGRAWAGQAPDGLGVAE